MHRPVRLALTLLFGASTLAAAQDSTAYPARRISGPRVGLTMFTPALRTRIMKELDRDNVIPIVTQFGWQTGVDVASNDKGGAAVVQGLVLVGGTEQGMFLPSATMLIGARSAAGTEFGLGPSLSLTGVGVAFGGGITKHSGSINIPINLGIVTGAEGLRISLLTGFNWRTKN